MSASREMNEIINKAALQAAGVGIPGSILPPLDMVGMSIIWFKLIRGLSKASGHKVNLVYASKFALSLTSAASLYLGGSKLLGALLHLIPGAGTLTAVTINSIFNWVYTLRLGKMLADQFSQPGFNTGTLMMSVSGITGLLFALPRADEVSDAFHSLGQVFGFAEDHHAVAEMMTTYHGYMADVADVTADPLLHVHDGAANLLAGHPDATAYPDALAYGDATVPSPIRHISDIRFGEAQAHSSTAFAMSGLEDLLRASPAAQHEGMMNLYVAAQAHGQTDLAQKLLRAIEGKGDIAALITQAHQTLPPATLLQAKVTFSGGK